VSFWLIGRMKPFARRHKSAFTSRNSSQSVALYKPKININMLVRPSTPRIITFQVFMLGSRIFCRLNSY